MHRSMKRSIAIAIVALATIGPFAAFAEDDLQVTLDMHLVVRDARGKETLKAADAARPGEVIEYRAVYHNVTDGELRQVTATLPIPQGMEYLPRTARPARAQASLDGRTFEVVPLMRRVRMPDGNEALREIPTSEYRYLRWTLGALAARGQESVRARVRLSPPQSPVAAATTH